MFPVALKAGKVKRAMVCVVEMYFHSILMVGTIVHTWGTIENLISETIQGNADH